MTITNDLTPKQNRVLQFIRESVARHNRPPTIRELGESCGGVHSSAVMCHLVALEKKGYIKRDEGVSRGIRIIEKAETVS